MSTVASAKTKHIRITPRKLRSVIDTVRGADVNKALGLLFVSKKRGSKYVQDTLKSAVANVSNREDKDDIDLDRLYIEQICVDEGPRLKRWMPRAMGRATPLIRRTSHLTIRLAQR